jgi:hypothetical protein
MTVLLSSHDEAGVVWLGCRRIALANGTLAEAAS